MSQESGCSSAGPSGSRLPGGYDGGVTGSFRLQSSQGSAGEIFTSKLTHVVAVLIVIFYGLLDWGPQFLAGCWWGLFNILSPGSLPREAHSIGQLVSLRGREQRVGKMKSEPLCNLISEATSHHYCLFYSLGGNHWV